jgi:hypothetical protein
MPFTEALDNPKSFVPPNETIRTSWLFLENWLFVEYGLDGFFDESE